MSKPCLHLEGGDSYDCVEWRFKPGSEDPILERPKRKRKRLLQDEGESDGGAGGRRCRSQRGGQSGGTKAGLL